MRTGTTGTGENGAAIAPYVEAWRRRRDGSGRSSVASAPGAVWFEARREEAFERFKAQGFPTVKDEAWRKTNLNALGRTPFTPAAPVPESALTPSLFEQLTFEPWDCTHLVFLNGRFAPGLSRIGRLPAGVRLKNLAAALAEDRDLLEPHLDRLARPRGRSLSDLNTALMDDGLFLHVPRGTLVEEPIHVLFVQAGNGTPAMTHPRNLLVVESGAQASVVESYGGIDGGVTFTNAVTEIVAGDDAVVSHLRLERERPDAIHIGHVEATLGRSAAFVQQSVSLGGGLVRQDTNAVLDGDGGDATLDGLYVLSGRQHADHHTLIDHARPHGTSRELYKGVLDGHARGIFDGTIVVRPDAQKTDARQVNRNLLLSEDSLADSKPTLLIHADDVKCSHAATIGQLEEQALFYLRSRALSEETARSLLIRAFIVEVLGRIRIEPVRAGLECLLFTRRTRP
jgi:Fe-S cluster assembly protein SufD